MRSSRYTLPAILLHWAHAGLVIGLLWLGWTMIDLPKGAERSAAYGLHKSLGLLALVLVLLRLLWRRRQAPPPPLPSLSAWQIRVSHGVHHALYAVLLLAPLAGYLASAFTPYPMKFFGLELPRLFAPDPDFNALFKSLHQGLVWGGAGLIALHVAGVVVHVWRREPILSRMLPGKSVQ